jgi:uncharacterized protein (DUF1778 family)
MGQPAQNDRRNIPLAVRFTEAERDSLNRAAQAAGLTLSDHIRRAALPEAPPPAARPKRAASRPSVKDADKLATLLAAVGRIGNNVNQLARVANAGSWPEARELHEAAADIQWMRHTLMQALGVRETAAPRRVPS